MGGLGAVYGWGILSRNARRLSGGVGHGKATSHGDFLRGGKSFPSGKSILAFSAATALSEGFNNRWWAAVPAYGLALMTGLGRMRAPTGPRTFWLRL